MKTIFLALGSNMGDRVAHLRAALDRLAPEVVVERQSKVYESEPMYVREQPRFYNMTVRAATDLSPHELLGHVKRVESGMGRELGTHNAPRPIDIDILLYEDEIVDTPELSIPHPLMHERLFVLAPLEEIAFAEVHPILRRPIVDLCDDVGAQHETLWEAAEQL